MNGTGLQLNNITKGAEVVHVLTSSERGEIASITALVMLTSINSSSSNHERHEARSKSETGYCQAQRCS